MQVYKIFFRILNRQKGQIIMYLCIFMGIATMVSLQASKDGGVKFEASSYKFSVFDEDHSEISQGLISYLSKKNDKVEIEDDVEGIQDELYDRNTSCVIRIPSGFGASMQQENNVKKMEISAVPGTIYAETFESLINKYISIVQGYIAGGYSVNESLSKADKTGDEQVSVKLADGTDSGSYSKVYYFFVYLPYIFISICVVGIGPILIVFHKKSVRDRNNCSSYPLVRTNGELLAGTITAGLGLCFIYFLLVLISTGGDVLNFKGVLYCLNMICFLVISLGLTFLLGQIVKKASALSMLSNIIGLGMSFLTGIFVPLDYLGDGIIRVAHFLPSYWYVIGVREVESYQSGASLSAYWVALGIELLFGIAIISIGLAYSRVKMKSSTVTE